MYNEWTYKFWLTIGTIFHLIFLDFPRDLYRWINLQQKDVRGQTVVITGGGSGLGQAMAKMMAERGARIIVIDVNKVGAEDTVRRIREISGEAEFFIGDVSEAKQMNDIASKIKNQFGNVDIVVCNAAVLTFKFFMEVSDEELKKAFDVNILGTVNTIRAFLGDMEARNAGQIVSVSSIAGFYGETYGLAYWFRAHMAGFLLHVIFTSRPTKFAVRGVMECLQMELRDRGLHNIKCTTICPYFARTPMVLNAGMRPTCTWFPFMSIDSCARRMVDAILKEKVMSFVPNYIAFVSLTKNWSSVNVGKTLRDYIAIRYQPTEGAPVSDSRELLPDMPDHFSLTPIHWWFIIPPALLINFLAWYAPSSLSFIPLLGAFVEYIGTNYHWLTVVTNVYALVAHLAEAVYALILCEKAGFSLACSGKWFLQTFILGFSSLIPLKKHVQKRA